MLTAFEIKNAAKPKLRDGDGLWLHASKAGNRSWVFIFIRRGRRREMGLGAYGTGTGHVSIVAARAKADEIRGILGRGGDPFTEMEERKATPAKPLTFGQVADEYIEAMKSEWRGDKTEASWRRFADVYAKALRKVEVAEVTTDEVLRVLRPLWHDKPETASKVRWRIKGVLDHARARGLRAGDNPAEWKGHLDQILPAPALLQNDHRAAMPYSDIPTHVAGLREGGGGGARALEFTILTAARSGETRGALWNEIDLGKKVWTISADRMKEHKEHRVPLSDAAVAIVEAMASIRQSDLVFPGAKPKRPISDMTMAKALRTAGGAGYTVHGFRSSFRDWAAEETQHQREVAEAALAHAVGDAAERAYRRGDALAKRRLLMDDWSKFCGGGSGKA
ncbi:MAG: integrase arm-type DNA-binding domain-containing protein [Devosia sp.]